MIYLLIFLAGVFVLIAAGIFWHGIFLNMLGFWPAIIADVIFVVLLVRHLKNENENTRYNAELRVKKYETNK